MFEWFNMFNGPMIGGFLGNPTSPHPLLGVPLAPGGKGISGRAQELLDAYGLANASLTCGKPQLGGRFQAQVVRGILGNPIRT